LTTISPPKIYLTVAAIVVALWAAVIWNNQKVEDRGLKNILRETSALALLFANHTDMTFQTVDLALREIREQYLKSPEQINKVVTTYLGFLGDAVLQADVISADARIVFSTPVSMQGRSIYDDREFFQFHQKSDEDLLFVSRPVKGKSTGKWTIQLTRPILKEGHFAGVVLIAVNPDYFVNFYEMAGMGIDGAARMIRDTGEVMARSSGQNRHIGKVVKPSPYADPGAPLRGSFRRSAQVDGVDRLSSYVRLPQYGLTVIIGPSVDERLIYVYEHQRQLIGFALALSILIVTVAYLIHKYISHSALAQVKREADHQELERRYEEIAELQEKLKIQALHDPLTGLYNRHFLYASLPMEMARAERDDYPVSFIMLDVDRFKDLNDTYGHASGDEVLVAIANCLKKNARQGDIVCRHGGEEFLILMPHITADRSWQRIEACRASIENMTFLLNATPVQATISAGIATYPEHGSEIDSLLRKADEALYKSKHEGRNRVTTAET